MNKLLSLGLLLTLLGCSTESVNCQDELASGKAVQITFPLTEGSCDYVIVLLREGESSKMECEMNANKCDCWGGTEYGTYRITVTDAKGETNTALQTVSAVSSPTCFDYDTLETFHPVDGMGGAGGAGGAHN